MKFRTLFSFIAASLAIPTVACKANDSGATPSSDEIALRWGKCRNDVMERQIGTNITAGELADQALNACKPLEDKYLETSLGPNWRASAAEQHKLARDSMIQRISEIRSGKSASDPSMAWGNCTGKQLKIEQTKSDSIEVSVERIMTACKPQEDAVVADAIQKFGDDGRNEVVGNVVPKVRLMMASQLQQARSQGIAGQ